jgi:hypothetical protein
MFRRHSRKPHDPSGQGDLAQGNGARHGVGLRNRLPPRG